MIIFEHVIEMLETIVKGRFVRVTAMPERKGGSAGLGLRERGKRERLRRIKEAAHEAFRTQGYKGASTREIARQADVSIGTLFVYAQDKRDLLFLVLNEDLDPLFRQALSGVLPDAPVLDQLVSLLRPIYEYFAAEPELARASLREMGHFDPRSPEAGKQAKRYNDRMTGWRDALAAILLLTKKESPAQGRQRLQVACQCAVRCSPGRSERVATG